MSDHYYVSNCAVYGSGDTLVVKIPGAPARATRAALAVADALEERRAENERLLDFVEFVAANYPCRCVEGGACYHDVIPGQELADRSQP